MNNPAPEAAAAAADPPEDAPPSPRTLGLASLALAALAAAVMAYAAWKLGDAPAVAAMAAKKGLGLGATLALPALLLGVAGRRSIAGKLGLAASLLVLLAAAVAFARVTLLG